MKQKYILLSLLLFFLIGCNSGEKMIYEKSETLDKDISYSSELNVKFHKVYCWLNLMPGPKAKPRFNVTGELEILESSAYDKDNLNLTMIKIKQNGKLLYEIKPDLRVNEKLSSNESKYVIFSTNENYYEKPELNRDEPVDVEFTFSTADKTFSYIVEKLTIEKAY